MKAALSKDDFWIEAVNTLWNLDTGWSTMRLVFNRLKWDLRLMGWQKRFGSYKLMLRLRFSSSCGGSDQQEGYVHWYKVLSMWKWRWIYQPCHLCMPFVWTGMASIYSASTFEWFLIVRLCSQMSPICSSLIRTVWFLVKQGVSSNG